MADPTIATLTRCLRHLEDRIERRRTRNEETSYDETERKALRKAIEIVGRVEAEANLRAQIDRIKARSTERRCDVCGTLITNAADEISIRVHNSLHGQPDNNIYELRYGDGEWAEVDRALFVRAERVAGFHNTGGFPEEPATAGFSNGEAHGRVRTRNG